MFECANKNLFYIKNQVLFLNDRWAWPVPGNSWLVCQPQYTHIGYGEGRAAGLEQIRQHDQPAYDLTPARSHAKVLSPPSRNWQRSLKIQFFSDIHLEFGPFELPGSDADIIVAAGDIGLGTSGLRWLQSCRQPVIYITGNHEFYGEEMLSARMRLKDAAIGSQVHYLERRTMIVDAVRFIGCTLWTDFAHGDQQLMTVAQENMNDYFQIMYRDAPLLPGDILAEHQESVSWLSSELNRPFTGKTVVVTHHAPTCQSWNQGPEHPLLGAYCNHLESFTQDFDIDLWIHGHIHDCADYHCGDTRIVCNPRGYHGYQQVPGFDAGKCVDIG